MKDYQGYFFDADGTLFDTAEMIYCCFRYTCKTFKNIEVTRQEVFAHMGKTLRPFFESLVGPLNDSEAQTLQQAHLAYQLTIYKEHLRLFPTVQQGLKALRDRGKKLAIVTSRKIDTLKLYLDHTQIAQFFNLLVTPEMTNAHKPHPQPVLHGLNTLGLKPADTLFVGDAIYDIQSGTSAGTDTAFVLWSTSAVESLLIQPTYIIKSFLEL